MIKRLALLIPAIKRLYLDRQRLAADKEAMSAVIAGQHTRIHDLQSQLERNVQEKLNLQQAVMNIALERDELKSSGLLSLSLRRRDLELTAQRASAIRAYAIIGSAGRTATQWIANVFNLHEKVFFSHGPDLEPRKGILDHERSDIALRIAQQINSFDFSDIDRYFDLLESRDNYLVYGNVHGLIPSAIYQRPNEYRRAYYACVVVRHPIRRVQSFINRWQYGLRLLSLRCPDQNNLSNDQTYREQLSKLSKRYKVDEPEEDAVLFLKALDVTLSYDSHYLGLGLPVYLMERLVSDLDYFLGLFYEVTARLVEPHNQYVAALKKQPPIDRQSNLVHAEAVFSSWRPWKRRFFVDEVERMVLLDTYHLLGYNLRTIFSKVKS